LTGKPSRTKERSHAICIVDRLQLNPPSAEDAIRRM
jgi:hypothetical protein